MKFIANMQGRLAMFHHSRDHREKALALYEKAYRGGSNLSSVLAAYGLLLLRQGSFAAARDVLEAALPVVNRKKPVHRMRIEQNLGLAYWKIGQVDQAVELYERVFSEYKTGMIYGTLGFLKIAQGDQTGDYTEALRFNLEALDYDDDSVILDNVGQVYLRMKDYTTAENYLRRALEKKDTQFDTMVCLAECLLERGEKEEALSLLKKAQERPFSHLNTVPRERAQELLDIISKA